MFPPLLDQLILHRHGGRLELKPRAVISAEGGGDPSVALEKRSGSATTCPVAYGACSCSTHASNGRIAVVDDGLLLGFLRLGLV